MNTLAGSVERRGGMTAPAAGRGDLVAGGR